MFDQVYIWTQPKDFSMNLWEPKEQTSTLILYAHPKREKNEINKRT